MSEEIGDVSQYDNFSGRAKDSDGRPFKSQFEIGGVKFTAESPPKLPGFVELEHLFEQSEPTRDKDYPGLGFSFIPSRLDMLPAGTFTLSRRMRRPGLRLPFKEKQDIAVRESPYGKVVDINSFGTPLMSRMNKDTDMLPLNMLLGYEVNNRKITGIPTPETLKKAALESGLPVELLPGTKLIPDELYLIYRSDGKYPIATGNEALWYHDIAVTNHIGAELAAADPLRASFGRIAEASLRERSRDSVAYTADKMDWYSSTLGSVVQNEENLTDEDFEIVTAENGRSLLVNAGLKIGISPAETEHVLATTQDNLKNLGVPTRQLK